MVWSSHWGEAGGERVQVDRSWVKYDPDTTLAANLEHKEWWGCRQINWTSSHNWCEKFRESFFHQSGLLLAIAHRLIRLIQPKTPQSHMHLRSQYKEETLPDPLIQTSCVRVSLMCSLQKEKGSLSKVQRCHDCVISWMACDWALALSDYDPA